MSKFVVSANYRNRKSEYKWLVRRYDESIDKAIPCKRVKCSNVKFEPSNKDEEGFGCHLVAVCESVSIEYAQTDNDLPTDHIRLAHLPYVVLAFDGGSICRTVPLAAMDHMELTSDAGWMYGYGNLVDGNRVTTPDATLPYKKALQRIHQLVYGIGGPLNDNKLFFNAPQKDLFRAIAQALDSVTYSESDET